MRIVDDFARQKNALVGKLPARLVRVVDGTLDTVTETKCLGEAHGGLARMQRVITRAQHVHQLTGIVGREGVLHLGLQAEAFAYVRQV